MNNDLETLMTRCADVCGLSIGIGGRVAGWQNLYEGRKGRKNWIWMKILSPSIRFFVMILIFVAIYALFGTLWINKVFHGQEVHYYYMVYIAYCTELKLQFWNYAQKRPICRKNIKYATDRNFCGPFALSERLPTSATLINGIVPWWHIVRWACVIALTPEWARQ